MSYLRHHRPTSYRQPHPYHKVVMKKQTPAAKKAKNTKSTKRFRMTENWRLAIILLPAVIVLFLVVNYVVLPRFQSWILSQIPGSTAVKSALQVQFPQESVSVSSLLANGTNGQKQRTLTVGVSGNTLLTQNQLAQAQRTVCSALGQNVQKYTAIYLENSQVHQVLMFYAEHGQSQKIMCQ